MVHARLELPKVIGSNMVLQRNALSPIWGKGDPGSEVTVAISGQVKKPRYLIMVSGLSILIRSKLGGLMK